MSDMLDAIYIASAPCPPDRAGQHAAALSLLKRMLQALERPMPAILTKEGGKPYFDAIDAPHFSYSHTKTHVFCALSPVPIGLDAEDGTVRPDVADRFLSDYLSPNETEDEEARLLAWTKRESLAKLTGDGFLRTQKRDCIWQSRRVDDILVTVATLSPYPTVWNTFA